MKPNAIAVALGAVTTLLWGLATVGLLNAMYKGPLFWLLAFLLAVGSGVLGGYLTAQRAEADREAMSTLAGVVAGLAVVCLAAVVSRGAPNTTLAAALLVLVWAAAGRAGAAALGRSQDGSTRADAGEAYRGQ